MSDIIHNPLNYVGSKDRLISEIKALLPKSDTIIEPFAGTFVVSLNSDFKHCIYNDKNTYLFNIIKLFKDIDTNYIIDLIDENINKYGLSKTNKDNFYEYRDYFNKSIYQDLKSEYPQLKNIATIHLLTLIYHSFNYFITMNKDGKYINTSGFNRSWFNLSLRKKLLTYCTCLKNKKIDFYNLDFISFYDTILNTGLDIKNTFWFLDPPYMNSDDNYSRTQSLKWEDKEEDKLYELCYNIDNLGGKFMMTNALECNGKVNDKLHAFSKFFNSQITNNDFYNCSYQRKNKRTQEVIIMNY